MKGTVYVWRVSLLACCFLAAAGCFAASETWINLNAPGPSPEARGFHGTSAVYNSGTNRLVVFAGRASTQDLLNDVWALTNANGLGGGPTWTNLIPNGAAGSPPARAGHSAVYDQANNRMIIFGGCGGYCLPNFNDVWVLENADGIGGTPTWTQLFPTGAAPAPRDNQTAVYDEANNRMIVFGGITCCTTVFTDTWILTNANGLGGTPAWTQLSPTGSPAPGGYGPSAIYDSATNRMTVFGGGTQSSGSVNGVWVLSNANGLGGSPAWTNTVANGAVGSPAKRGFHTATYDAGSNRMTIFGGGGNNPPSNDSFNDAWVLSNANGLGGSSVWTRLTPTGVKPEGRGNHCAAYDSGTNRMIMFGGSDNNNDGWFNYGWVLTHANGL